MSGNRRLSVTQNECLTVAARRSSIASNHYRSNTISSLVKAGFLAHVRHDRIRITADGLKAISWDQPAPVSSPTLSEVSPSVSSGPLVADQVDSVATPVTTGLKDLYLVRKCTFGDLVKVIRVVPASMDRPVNTLRVAYEVKRDSRGRVTKWGNHITVTERDLEQEMWSAACGDTCFSGHCRDAEVIAQITSRELADQDRHRRIGPPLVPGHLLFSKRAGMTVEVLGTKRDGGALLVRRVVHWGSVSSHGFRPSPWSIALWELMRGDWVAVDSASGMLVPDVREVFDAGGVLARVTYVRRGNEIPLRVLGADVSGSGMFGMFGGEGVYVERMYRYDLKWSCWEYPVDQDDFREGEWFACCVHGVRVGSSFCPALGRRVEAGCEWCFDM